MTTTSLQDFLNMHPAADEYALRPYVLCADGSAFSLQDGAGCCAYPAGEDYPATLEVACRREALLDDAGHNAGALHKLLPEYFIYSYVPMDTLDAVIAAHGGIVGEAAPDQMWGCGKAHGRAQQ